jgi:hypothetical protein
LTCSWSGTQLELVTTEYLTPGGNFHYLAVASRGVERARLGLGVAATCLGIKDFPPPNPSVALPKTQNDAMKDSIPRFNAEMAQYRILLHPMSRSSAPRKPLIFDILIRTNPDIKVSTARLKDQIEKVLEAPLNHGHLPVEIDALVVGLVFVSRSIPKRIPRCFGGMSCSIRSILQRIS